jgi:NAD(P)-dependent dehydrogenase (short-subunit alcohol dehydrogenase family)
MSENHGNGKGPGRRQVLTGAGTLAAAAALGGASAAAAPAEGKPPPAKRFAGKVVLITGGTSGIGAATARAFAREGAAVVICGRREGLGKEVEREARAKGGKVTYVRADVREHAQVADLVARTEEIYGPIDIAFNNAGIEGPFTTLSDVNLQGTMGYQDTIRTNLDGVFHAMREELTVMLPRKRGTIINTASIAGSQGLAGNATYAASKHGVLGLTRSAALAHAREGIRVVAVSPGAVDTPLLRRAVGDNLDAVARSNPTGRVGQPEEIAALVLDIASNNASYINGADFRIDGGATA